jgi:predicted transcriptional regulator
MNKLPTLEQRIAAALTSTDITSSDLAALIAEVEAAAQAADENATKVRDQALDPAVAVDTTKVATAMATAILTRDRLQAALPHLHARHKQLQAKEYEARWYADLEEVGAKRDALVEELRVYPTMVAKLVNILSRIPAIDAEVSRLNCSAPPGVSERLRTVEQVARNADGFVPSGNFSFTGLLSLATDLRLPKFEFDGVGDRYQFSWPPPQPNLALQYLATIPPDPFIISEAAKGTYIEARNRRVLEDNRRQIAEAEQRQREFEEAKGRRG